MVKIFKLTSYHIIMITTAIICSINLQAQMLSKEHDSHQHQMKMPIKQSLMVMNGWVRLTPPVAKNSAAYFIFHNTSDKDVTVVGVSSKIAKMTMMHDVVIEKSMARMVHLDKVKVPAGRQVAFAPGGKHLMLVGLTKKLEAGKDVQIQFELDNGEVINTMMKIKSEGEDMSTGHQH